MRNIAAFLGFVVGANVGWLFGSVVDGYSAWFNQVQADHTYAYVMTFVMASVLALSFRSIVGDLSKRHAAAQSKVERVEAKTQPTRAHTGRTPPAPFPAFQA